MGTGETTRRLIEAYPDAWVIGLDASPDMVFRARQSYDDVQLARMEDPLPDGPWDLVISVLSVNELDDEQTQALCRRVHEQSRSLVIGDVFEPDKLKDLLDWSGGKVTWQADDLAVVAARTEERVGHPPNGLYFFGNPISNGPSRSPNKLNEEGCPTLPSGRYCCSSSSATGCSSSRPARRSRPRCTAARNF